MSSIFLDLIHSFIISLLFSSRTPSSNFEVSPLIFVLLSFSFQKSGSFFSASFLISSCCSGLSELNILRTQFSFIISDIVLIKNINELFMFFIIFKYVNLIDPLIIMRYILLLLFLLASLGIRQHLANYLFYQ